jgi:hypothetical protein
MSRILPEVRWFLAGYAAGPLLLMFCVAIAIGHLSVANLVSGLVMMWLMSPVGLMVGMLCGTWPGWGPWDGQLVFMGFAAGLFVLVAAGLWLENRLIGRILLAIAGAALSCLGFCGLGPA